MEPYSFVPKAKYPSKAYQKALKWLRERGTNGYKFFDYPDYAGMPKEISHRLTSEEVDNIQESWPE